MHKLLDNVLVLSGGAILFLKTMNRLDLLRKDIQEDIKNLEFEEFLENYDFT